MKTAGGPPKIRVWRLYRRTVFQSRDGADYRASDREQKDKREFEPSKTLVGGAQLNAGRNGFYRRPYGWEEKHAHLYRIGNFLSRKKL